MRAFDERTRGEVERSALAALAEIDAAGAGDAELEAALARLVPPFPLKIEIASAPAGATTCAYVLIPDASSAPLVPTTCCAPTSLGRGLRLGRHSGVACAACLLGGRRYPDGGELR